MKNIVKCILPESVMKVLLCIIATAGLCAAETIYGDSVLAVVGETVITAYEVQMACQAPEQQLIKVTPSAELKKAVAALRRQTLDGIIEKELIYLEFKQIKATVPPSFMRDRLNKIIKTQAGGDQEKFEEMLHMDNMTLDELKERLNKDVAIEAMVYEKTRRGVQFSDPQAAEYFEAHKGEYARKASYRVEVIMLKKDKHTEDEIFELQKTIRVALSDGEEFGNLARKYSDGANAANGGDQGWQQDMNEQLLSVVKTLNVGEVYQDNLEIGKNIYIVRLAELLPGSEGTLTPELLGEVKERMVKEEQQRRYDAFIAELKMKYPVRRMD